MCTLVHTATHSHTITEHINYIKIYLFYFFFMELLVWHCLIKLCRFQVYNSIRHHWYIVLCSPPQVRSPSITVYPPLPSCTSHQPPSLWSSPWCCLCLWGVFFCLNPFSFFTQHPQSSAILTPHSLLSVSMNLFLFCLFILFIRFHM